MNFLDTVIIAWNNFDIVLAVMIFVAYLLVDALYAQYTFHVTQYKEYSAATIGALMHFILAFGVLNYVQNFLYVVPLAMGSWVGTFLVIRRERLKRTNEIS